jgi:glycosyltransferase involved in cell wall biosynthesis
VNASGVGRYSRQLAAALGALRDLDGGPALEVGVFGPAAHAAPSGAPSWAGAARNIALESPLATQGWLPARLWAYRPALTHSTAFVGPLWGPRPLVVTFPDLIYHQQPADYDRLWRFVIETFAPRTARRAAAIATLSRCTAEDLARAYGVPRRKIHVVPSGVDDAFFAPISPDRIADVRARYGLPERYGLHSGALVRRKNLVMLVRAFSRLVAAGGGAGLTLALTGRPALGMPGAAELEAAIADSPARARIRLLGHVPAADLPALYAGAALLVYPTLYEGQGLPPLEAMAAGTPVLASDTPAVAEAVGGAALLVDPRDERAWTAALARLLDDSGLRASLTARGRVVAASYAWPRIAERTLQFYLRVAAPAPR